MSTDLEVRNWGGGGEVRDFPISVFPLQGLTMVARLEFLRDSSAFADEVALAPD